MTVGVSEEEAAAIPLFKGLNADELTTVCGLLHTKTFATNTAVLTMHQKGSSVYFIRYGTVKICSEGRFGNTVIIAIVGAGDILGEIHTVDGLGHSADVVTLEKVSVFWMDSEEFHTCRRTMWTLDENLMRMLAQRARFTTARLHVLATSSMRGRLASQLLAFASGAGVPAVDGVLIPLNLTQLDLASLIGASRQHVNSILQNFKEQRYISTNAQNRIIIHNSQALERCE